ncbi:hypothetical protein OAK60_02415, partial [Akkermansiaceae bacterium]|nr:hypothetical protein [Akkermansiaceae bacterium]
MAKEGALACLFKGHYDLSSPHTACRLSRNDANKSVSFSVILQAILPVYLLVGVGLFLRGAKVVTPEMEKGMLKMVIHCLYPCLILDKTLGNELVRHFDVLAWGVGL